MINEDKISAVKENA